VPLLCGIDLCLQQVYPCVRKIRQPTRMVKIKMRKDDMPDIICPESQRFYTRAGRQHFPSLNIIHYPEKA